MNQKVQNRIKAFGFAIEGAGTFFKEGVHAKWHALATLGVLIGGFYFSISRIEWVAVLLCIGMVLGLEAVNSAIEYLTDLVSPQYHDLAKKAKDVSAAAVLFAASISFIIALIIFVPKLL